MNLLGLYMNIELGYDLVLHGMESWAEFGAVGSRLSKLIVSCARSSSLSFEVLRLCFMGWLGID